MRSAPAARHSSSDSSRGERGTTLAELTLTLALVAIVALGVVATWGAAQEAYFAAADAAEVQQNLRAALDLVAAELRAAGRDGAACAFDHAGPGSFDCSPAKAALCRARLGPGYPSSGCQGVFAIPYADATPTTIRIRSDRNANGTVAVGANGDAGEEDVRYALTAGSPPCPPGVSACITRDGGAGPVPVVAVEITEFRLTYYPRPGYPPCDARPPQHPCPPFAQVGSQRDADNIGRVTIAVTAISRLAGLPTTRRLETDVVLVTRN